jgi:hypothetical protein
VEGPAATRPKFRLGVSEEETEGSGWLAQRKWQAEWPDSKRKDLLALVGVWIILMPQEATRLVPAGKWRHFAHFEQLYLLLREGISSSETRDQAQWYML